MGYKNPILIEIYSELFFAPESLVPATFFELVPDLKKLGFTQIEFGEISAIRVEGDSVSHGRAPRIRCWTEDKAKLVQLSPDQVVVNQVGDYLGWDSFKQQFCQVREMLSQREVNGVRSLSLTTIDEFTRPASGFKLGGFLACGGPILPKWYEDAAEPCDLRMGRGVLEEDERNRQYEVTLRRASEKLTARIRSTFQDKVGEGDDLAVRLEQLHEESSKSFEDLITDKTRNELMGGLE